MSNVHPAEPVIGHHPRRHVTYICVGLVLAALLTSTGCLHRDAENTSDPRNAEVRLAAHIEQLPVRVSDVEIFGPVEHIDCRPWRRYVDVQSRFLCLVRYRNGTVSEWCISVEPDRVRTNHERRDGEGPGCV